MDMGSNREESTDKGLSGLDITHSPLQELGTNIRFPDLGREDEDQGRWIYSLVAPMLIRENGRTHDPQ